MNYTFGLMCHSYTSKMHFPFINHATFLLFQAALGGPLVGKDDRFHGMIFDLCHYGFENRKRAKFLTLKSLYERLELFQILKYVFGSSSICELYLPHLIIFVNLFLVLHRSLVGFHSVICGLETNCFFLPTWCRPVLNLKLVCLNQKEQKQFIQMIWAILIFLAYESAYSCHVFS